MIGNKIYQRLTQLFNSDKLPWVIIALGIILRLIRYVHNPSLWFDEADTAVDIISRPFLNLIEPSPDWSSKYPYGFLLLVKSATQIFDNSEYSLRLVSILFGILSVFLFYRVAKNYVKPPAIIVALGLFAILDPLIFQSSNLKPYTADLFFALLIFIWLDYIKSKKINITDIAFAGLVGAIMIWFSYAALFVLAGVGSCLAVFSLSKKDWSRAWHLAIIYFMWASSFIAFYFIYIRNLQSNFDMSVEDLLMWERAFVPFPPKSLNDIRWIIDTFFEIFRDPVGLTFTGIAAFLFLVGCISIFQSNKEKFYLLISPVFFTLLASILHQYPFKNRLIIFLVPFILLFIAEGVEFVREKTSVKSTMLGMVLVGLLFIYPVSWTVYHAKSPTNHEEIRPAINYIKNNWQDGDIIYVHYYAQYAFEYYTKYHPDRHVFNQDDFIISIAPRGWYRTWRKQHVYRYYKPDAPIRQTSTDIFKAYINDLNKLKGHKRAWILFTATIVKDGIQEEKFIVFNLDTIGKRLGFFGHSGVGAVYLYDLSEDALMVDKE
jgi:hypothetical protein